MKTMDGHEIILGKSYFLENGEIVIAKDTFPDSETTCKIVVTPQFYIESMYASCDGGSHHEVSTEIDFEAEDSIVLSRSLFGVAPSARIDSKILEKERELDLICQKIGYAKVLLLTEQKESALKTSELKKETKTAKNELNTIMEKLERIISSVNR